MQDSLVRKALLYGKVKDSIIPKSKTVLRNKIVTRLLQHKAIERSLRVYLEKAPTEQQREILERISCLKAPLRNGITPIPEDEICELNIQKTVDLGYLYIEAYGTNHDSIAWLLAERIVEVAYNVRIQWVIQNDSVLYKGKAWSNLARIAKEEQTVGLMYWVRAGDNGEQICAEVGEEKVLFQYDFKEFLLKLRVHCPPHVKRKALAFLRPFEEKFYDLSNLPQRRFLERYSSR